MMQTTRGKRSGTVQATGGTPVLDASGRIQTLTQTASINTLIVGPGSANSAARCATAEQRTKSLMFDRSSERAPVRRLMNRWSVTRDQSVPRPPKAANGKSAKQ